MSFEELFATVKAKMAHLEARAFGQGQIAYEFVLTGEGGGTFYALIKDGVLAVEPYDYKDYDCRLTMRASDFLKLMDGKLNPVASFTLGKLKVDGDIGKALLLSDVLKSKK